jgi:hypothetical protein
MSKLYEDLLVGAGAIALELYGRDTAKNRRRVYYRHQEGRLPTWKDGEEIITRKSLLNRHYERAAERLAGSAPRSEPAKARP